MLLSIRWEGVELLVGAIPGVSDIPCQHSVVSMFNVLSLFSRLNRLSRLSMCRKLFFLMERTVVRVLYIILGVIDLGVDLNKLLSGSLVDYLLFLITHLPELTFIINFL